MSVVRMAMGAHFFTDVVFAAIFTFIIIVLMHGLIFRLQPSDSESKTETPSKPES
jgi:membrane-associated phospholipid phosphatase